MLQIDAGTPHGAPATRLERDVVFGTAATAAGGTGRGSFEVGGVGGNVTGRGEGATATAVAAAPGAVTGAEELDRVGDDLDRLAFSAVFCLPLAPLESAFDRYRPAP